MTLRLIDDDIDISLEIPLSEVYREAVQIQMQRCAQAMDPLPFEIGLVERITELVDGDLHPSQRCRKDGLRVGGLHIRFPCAPLPSLASPIVLRRHRRIA